ncbi:MAG: trypsin-like peptidase domain-containing protein, partial [Isosphaeraceae bacterium]
MPLLRRREGFLVTFALSLSVAAVSLGSASVAAGPGTVPTGRRTAIVDAVDKAQSCVVSISSEKKAASNSRWPFSAEENQRPRISGMGSGVIVDSRGYILTNHHVVDKVQGIEVQLADGTTYPGRVLQYDPVMDLA